jgi:hypothetical protein
MVDLARWSGFWTREVDHYVPVAPRRDKNDLDNAL